MSIIELIGFIIIVLAMSFLYLKNVAQKARLKNDPKAREKQLQQQREAEIALMKALGMEMPKEFKKQVMTPEPPFEEEDFEEEEPYMQPPPLIKEVLRPAPSFKKPTSLRDFIVMKEVLDKPRALKDFDESL